VTEETESPPVIPGAQANIIATGIGVEAVDGFGPIDEPMLRLSFHGAGHSVLIAHIPLNSGEDFIAEVQKAIDSQKSGLVLPKTAVLHRI
jgi:hypothetical protein